MNQIDMDTDITIEELKAANQLAKSFYVTMGGKEARHVVMALGLIMRCITEEQMIDPDDEDERESRLHAILAITIATLDHPAVNRKPRTQ